MRTTLFFIVILIVTSCTTYRVFIPVADRNDIPDGTQYIILNSEIEQVRTIFNSNGVMTRSFDGGFETETVLIDEGTRAMYKVHQFDEHIRISAFWGITQKVKAQISTWAGHAASSTYDVHAFDQVIYDGDVKRPKQVFDYAVQILESSNQAYSFR